MLGCSPTAPHSDSAAVAAAGVSDLVLIPCRPAYFDLEAMANTLRLLRTTGKPLWGVLNAVAPFGSEAEEAAETIQDLDLRLCPAQLGRRIAFSRAVSSGWAAQEVEPDGKAAAEVRRLYELVASALAVAKQLKHLVLNEDRLLTELVGEALDLLFQSRGLPTIAQQPQAQGGDLIVWTGLQFLWLLPICR